MRGDDTQPTSLFSYVHLEDRIPADHPLRLIRALIDPMLGALSPRFDALYATHGRPSIAPEKLLRALLLQVLYTIRSERQLMEQLNYNLLFRSVACSPTSTSRSMALCSMPGPATRAFGPRTSPRRPMARAGIRAVTSEASSGRT